MKLVTSTPYKSTEADAAALRRSQFEVMDFLKLLAAAMLCGIVFSLCAAVITLTLLKTTEIGESPETPVAVNTSIASTLSVDSHQ